MGTTRLYLTTTVEEQWRSLVGPWLKEQAGVAWKNPKPTVVLTPSRAESFYLRSRLVEENIPFLGLRFGTPSDARKFLLGELSSEVASASQSDLRLLARCCAEKLLQARKVPDHATLTSVAQEPGAFLRAYDLLIGAGWDPAKEGPVYGRLLAKELTRELKNSRIATQAGLHRHLLKQGSVQKEPLVAKLLVVGFNATHWPLWDLLRAVVSSAEQATISLSAPRFFGEKVDQLWISSWEEVAEVSTEIPQDANEPNKESKFAELIASYERGISSTATESDLTFLVTPDLASQVHAIVLKIVDYLKRDSCTRLGIVFPEANALALGIAEQLVSLGIPLDDGTGSIQPGLFERRFWQTWLTLQAEPSVQKLTQWVCACEAQGKPCGIEDAKLSARDLADVLENALSESLVDDLNFLSLHLEETSSRSREKAVADFLRKRIQLPETALFSEFLSKTREALGMLQWDEHLSWLQANLPTWLLKSDQLFSRRTFLEWLKEATNSQERTRGREGNHFYGKVHLLIYAQMTGQMWSHLILTGLNEGVWPRPFEEGAFGSRHELAALNQQSRSLNRIGIEQGAQGVGHEVVKMNQGYCLLALEKQDLALRDLCASVEGTTDAVCLTAMTSDAGRSLLPSDFFNHAYLAKTGQVLDEAPLRSLATATSEWCQQHEKLLNQPISQAISSPTIAATRNACEARRNVSKSFGPYEFAFAQPPVQPIQLSCKTWETAWNHPALIWLEHIVGVSSWPEGTLSWPRAVGTWVHRWLKTALRLCDERNSAQDFLLLLREAADREVVRVQNRAHAVGMELYPWWDQVCGQAKSIAFGLGQTLAPHLQHKRLLSEFTLPENIKVALPGSEHADFALTGRIDLLLVESGTKPVDAKRGDFSDCSCWVIDFKTGSAQKLSPKMLEKGKGLQPLLYALAIHARGARTVSISLSTFDAPLKSQMDLEDALEITPLFRSLDILHRSGIFGMRGETENDYGYAPAYPMATRFIPGNILDAKWALVHNSASSEEESE